MPRVKVYDVPGGDTVTYDLVDEANGYLQPIFFRSVDERFEDFFNITNLQCRDDDILLNSYPKTGTHWVWEIVTLLLKRSSDLTGRSKTTQMIECIPTSKMGDEPSPRVLNTHLKIKYLPKEVFSRKIKTVLVCRNPKDVVVSLYHHTKGISIYDYDGKFENFFEMFLRGEVEYGVYAEYLLEWQTFIREHPDHHVHVSYYEDLKQDLLGEIKRLRRFLELDITDAIIEEIGLNLAFKQMKVGKEKAMTQDDRDFQKAISKSGFSFLRKGEVGDWQNYFTVAQNEAFDAWWEKGAVGLDMFKFRYV